MTTPPNHCKECSRLTEVSRSGLKKPQAKTYWCNKQGQRADHAVGHCKLTNLKEWKLS